MVKSNSESPNPSSASKSKPSKKLESKQFVPSGLPAASGARYHYDIYAILEAPQELYFGSEKEVNINLVEKVRIVIDNQEVEKCYLSPTKRRGIERRALLWSDAQGKLLMDQLECGIPATCCKDECPICRVFGGMVAGKKTFIGRLSHAGGVAVSPTIALEKQRAMHPALIHKNTGENPTPYRKEYAQPGLLYPISNHAVSIDEHEFSVMAYAFIMSLQRLGAGNPKGIWFARGQFEQDQEAEPLLQEAEPLLVVDKYRVPCGERPILSPTICDNSLAKHEFIRLTHHVNEASAEIFSRSWGNQALELLQSQAQTFERTFLSAQAHSPWPVTKDPQKENAKKQDTNKEDAEKQDTADGQQPDAEEQA